MYQIIRTFSDSRFCLAGWLLLGGHLILIPAAARSQSPPSSPVAAEQTLALFELHPDCRIELVAAEPDVIDPVAMAFAPDGKLWVVEYSDYPNGPPENGPPLSRIRVLTDSDGDGRYTRPVTFADKLLFANGLMLWQDGVIVTTDGAVVFMRDGDGDGRADEQETWFTGFKRENPQLRANHPTLALDGHIYIASGLRGGEVVATKTDWPAFSSASISSPLPPEGERVPEGRVRGSNDRAAPSPQPSPPNHAGSDRKGTHGGEGAYNPKPVSLSGRDFRFDPFTGTYESVSGVGQFGLCFDPFGNRFVCSNRNPCKHIVLEDHYLARNPHLAVKQVHEDVSPAAENSRLFPISRTWTTSNLHANQFTAACGVLIYGGDALPQFRGNSFICEPTANLVHRDVLTPKGATFTSKYGREGVEFLASRDEWFRPVNLKHGPDGALYVVDMYRAVIEHPQFMPTELKTRPDLTLGNDRGRIYRIISKEPVERKHDSSFRIDQESLVTHLTSPNTWHRDTAFRLLYEQGSSTNSSVEGLLQESLSAESLFAALCLLDANDGQVGLGIDPAVRHADMRVRIPLVRMFERDAAIVGDAVLGEKDYEQIFQGVVEATLHRENEQLAFHSVLALGPFPATQQRASALGTVLFEHAHDRWFRAAVGSSSAGQEVDVLHQALSHWKSRMEQPTEAAGDPPLVMVGEFAQIVGSRGDVDGAADILRAIVEPLETESDERTTMWQRMQFTALLSLSDGLRRSKSSLNAALISLTDEERKAILEIFTKGRGIVADSEQPASLRVDAMSVVAIDPSTESTDVLRTLVRAETDQSVLTGAIDALSRKSDEGVANVMLDGFRSRTPSVRSAILNALLARTDRTVRLLDEIESGNLSPRDIDAATAGRLTKSRDAAIKQRATKLLASAIDANRAKVVAQYQPCLSQRGDPQRGREIFLKTCAICHKMGDVGTNVGPDISDSRTKTPEFLLTNILDPNRAVDGNYFGYTILDRQGRVHTGIITAETASSVTLRIQEGKDLTFLRSDIEEMSNTGLSLMPVGVEKDITVDQMADLISYIKNWRYLDGLVPEEVIGR